MSNGSWIHPETRSAAMPQRRRTIDALLDDDDVDTRLFARRLPSQSAVDDSACSAVDADSQDEFSAAGATPTKAHRTESSLSVAASAAMPRRPVAESRLPPRTNSFSLFGTPKSSGTLSAAEDSQEQDIAVAFPTQLGRHRQQQAADVDGLLFAVAAAAQRPSISAYAKIFALMDDNTALLQWVRRCNRSSEFVRSLATGRPSQPAARFMAVVLVSVAVHTLPAVACAQETVFAALRAFLDGTDGDAETAVRLADKPKRRHWSSATTPPPAEDTKNAGSPTALAADLPDSVRERISATATSALGRDVDVRGKEDMLRGVTAELAAKTVLDIVLGANAQASVGGSEQRDTVAKALARGGLWTTASEALRDPTSKVAQYLVQAIEATTCVRDATHFLQGVIDPSDVYDAVRKAFVAAACQGAPESNALITKVFMNLTTAFPRGIAQLSPFADEVALAAAKLIRGSHAAGDTDGATLITCLLLNLLTVRAEDDQPPGDGKQHVNATWRQAFVRCRPLLDVLAESVVSCHHASGEEVAAHVTSGYMALFLAAVTLGEEDARVRVVTAVAPHLPEHAANTRSVAAHPMRYVAALVQEFVLFQSDAGILTRESLLTMHRISTQLLVENGGVVPPATQN
jgi:hypothetical protein